MHELSLHILDIVENSTAAGAKTVTLTIEEDDAKDTLLFRVEDDGKGMDEALLARIKDPFVTTRTVRKVGLGIPLLEMTATMCDGGLSLRSKPGAGTQVEARYRKSHLDRPPLGNMKATLKGILVLNPTIHIVYRHQVGEQVFCLDSAEIHEALGDMPLTSPEVLDWLDEYLEGNFKKLYGGLDE